MCGVVSSARVLRHELRAVPRHAWLAVVFAATGYFVDIYDLVLFGVVRRESLEALGVGAAPAATSGPFGALALQWDIVTGAAAGNLEQCGAALFSAQMLGLLLGGFLWGILGDRRGRLSVLLGSILLYSLANVGNAFVTGVPMYAVCRLVAGIGLAGELGAGITLVSEQLPPRVRGYGTMIVATVGLAGAVAAGLVGDRLGREVSLWLGGPLQPWQVAYLIGGGMGLGLLAMRMGVVESGLYASTRATSDAPLGSVRMLFWPPARAARYLAVLAIGVPIWFVGGILFVFAPEIGLALGLHGEATPRAGTAVVLGYGGAVIGDCVSGLLSQGLQSRRRVVGLFLGGIAAGTLFTFAFGGRSTGLFYAGVFVTGLATGYWAIFITIASECFGTNLRATATTTAPNLVRGSAVLVTQAWQALGGLGISSAAAALAVGALCIGGAFLALARVPETFARDLRFEER